MYYPYCDNKGADQLRGYREADLRLCFRICKKPVFSRRFLTDIAVCCKDLFTSWFFSVENIVKGVRLKVEIISLTATVISLSVRTDRLLVEKRKNN